MSEMLGALAGFLLCLSGVVVAGILAVGYILRLGVLMYRIGRGFGHLLRRTP